MTCIATPISWPRLERFAQSGGDAQIAVHVEACAACASCLREIKGDVVVLRPIVVPPRRRPWGIFAIPALAVAAAIVIVVWPREQMREDVVTVKGIGEVILGVVRERDGTIRDDATTFLPGDRWKVVVTCPPSASAHVQVDVAGDKPLAPAQIACGNRVVVPGAFHLTGTSANRICVRVSSPADAGTACVTITPE